MTLYHIDAFADRAFRGNPAGVCLPDAHENLSDADMQNIAAELNLSETAFYRDGKLRWFTPDTEVDLCGHATLAAAFALWESRKFPKDRPILFDTKSGEISAHYRDGRVMIDLPAKSLKPVPPIPELADAFGGITTVFCGRSQFDFLLEIESPKELRSLWPNISKLGCIPGRGVIVTAPSDDPRYDFMSRFFAPQVGIDEDPVTGSAHCVLAPYWAKKLGKTGMTALQVSKRGGVLEIELKGDRVELTGGAVIIFRASPDPQILLRSEQ